MTAICASVRLSHFPLSNVAFQKRKESAERSNTRSIMKKNQFLKVGAWRQIEVEQQDHSCHPADGFSTPSPSAQVSLWSKPCHALNGREFFWRRLLTTSKRISIAKAALNKKVTLLTSKLDLNFRKQVVKCYIWSIVFYGAETWTLRKIDHKSLGGIEMWCWRRMEEIILTERVKMKCYKLSREKGRLTGLVTNWVGNSF